MPSNEQASGGVPYKLVSSHPSFRRKLNPTFVKRKNNVKTLSAIILASVLPALLDAAYPISSARAESIVLKSDLKGSNEVPPNNSPASGRADVTFDTTTKTLTWEITYTGLSGPVRGAHFHGPGEQGKNAGIVLPFMTVETPIRGSAALRESQAADLLAGKWYANIHTDSNPGGEIRGQITR